MEAPVSSKSTIGPGSEGGKDGAAASQSADDSDVFGAPATDLGDQTQAVLPLEAFSMENKQSWAMFYVNSKLTILTLK